MIVTLADNKYVALEVLAQDIPGVITGARQAADTQPLTLTDGVVHEPVMLANHLAGRGFDVAGLGRQILLEEVAEAALANKTDAGGILLARGGKVVLFGNAAHLRLLQFADREQGAGNLFASDRMQEIALVLVVVQSAQQQGLSIAIGAAAVMTGGDQVGAQSQGVIEKGLELDLAVTEDIRIRRAPGLVFGQKVLEYVIPVLGGKVGGMQPDAQPVSDRLGVGQVVLGGAVFGAVILVPVLHEQAFDLIPLLQQQGRRNRGINTAGHADNHAGLSWGGR